MLSRPSKDMNQACYRFPGAPRTPTYSSPPARTTALSAGTLKQDKLTETSLSLRTGLSRLAGTHTIRTSLPQLLSMGEFRYKPSRTLVLTPLGRSLTRTKPWTARISSPRHRRSPRFRISRCQRLPSGLRDLVARLSASAAE